MFSDLTSIRAALKARLQPEPTIPGDDVEPGPDTLPSDYVLPTKWRYIDHISEPVESLTPVVYTEFAAISPEANGQPLGRDAVACNVDLVVAAVSTDNKVSEAQADEYVHRLIRAINHDNDDIFFSSARKERETNGSVAWRVSIVCIASTEIQE